MNTNEYKDLVASMDSDSLAALKRAVEVEASQRRRLEAASEVLDGIAREYSDEVGRTPGDPWEQPTGAHDAYPKAAVVTHKDTRWVNLVAANVWEPGVSGWREETTNLDQVSEWIQPTGAHDAYRVGERVKWGDNTYRSTIDGNVWNPSVNPTGWIQDLPVSDNSNNTPEVSEWVQPTGGHDAYSTGDQVLWEGDTYESVIDGNSWSPGAYPAGWKLL